VVGLNVAASKGEFFGPLKAHIRTCLPTAGFAAATPFIMKAGISFSLKRLCYFFAFFLPQGIAASYN
jgi:hypothetical protein